MTLNLDFPLIKLTQLEMVSIKRPSETSCLTSQSVTNSGVPSARQFSSCERISWNTMETNRYVDENSYFGNSSETERGHKCSMHAEIDVPLVEFISLVFTCIPGESYHRRLRSLLLYLCYVFWALINSLVCRFLFLRVPVNDISVGAAVALVN